MRVRIFLVIVVILISLLIFVSVDNSQNVNIPNLSVISSFMIISDAQIESEIGILMTKLEQLRPEDSEVKEKRVVESVDTSAAEHVDKSSQSCQSIGSGSGSGSRRVMTETRGKRRFVNQWGPISISRVILTYIEG